MRARFFYVGMVCWGVVFQSCWGAERMLVQFEKGGRLLEPVVVELFEGDAPAHVENVKRLVRKGFYEGLAVHRVVPQTLVQLGDPLGRGKGREGKGDLGTGGPGYTLAPEIGRRHLRGAVGMGRLPDAVNPGRLSNGSQFFFALRELPELDGGYTVFGQVRKGMEVLDGIGAAATDTNDAPVQAVVVRRMGVYGEEKWGEVFGEMREAARRGKRSWWRRLLG